MTRTRDRRRSGGFSLVEVLVSMIVIAVGLLGIAKMQSLALSSTGVASLRSIAALEASALAATMHADRGYWAQNTAALTVTISGTTITPAVPFQTVADCLSGGADAPCTPAKMAAYDVQQWANDVGGTNGVLPGPVTTIACSALTATAPVSCTIQIIWGENAVAINKQGTAASAGNAAINTPVYTLYVQP